MKTRHRVLHRSFFTAIGILATSALIAGCAHLFGAPPSNASAEGVRVTIRQQECMPSPQASDPSKAADLVIGVEIHNPSPAPVVVQRGAMRVIDAEGGAMTRRGTAQTAPLQVAAGGDERLEMHFLGSAEHCCSSRLALDPSGVTSGDRALAIGRIPFVPACLF